MRALIPQPSDVHVEVTGGVDLHAHYGAEWVQAGGVRANFVCSVDGAASAGGRSAGLQTPGDNAVFAALRDLADVVLVGAGTAVAEGYRPVRLADHRVSLRRALGFADALPIAVTSRTLRLDADAALFSAGFARTIVLTCASADAHRRRQLSQVADVVVCGDDVVDPAAARYALEARGHRRILSEGGPTAFADLVGAGVADELCLTVSPTLIGPGPGRIVAGGAWADSSVVLTGLLEEDGALFTRYRFGRAGVKAPPS